MNIKKIQELVALMNENDLTEIEIEQEGTKIRLIRKAQGVVEQQVVHAPIMPQPVTPQQGVPATEGAQAPSGKFKEIKSPMVGTFYRAPSPEADPYIQVGDVIKKGDVLCIVEAMKLMNEVKAEVGGKIVEILVDNAEPVEFGQPMFLIEPV